MNPRSAARLPFALSPVSLGCWQLGGDWGDVTEDSAHAVLAAALDAGVTFLDTADVYGDGRSERLIGAFLAGRSDLPGDLRVATKMGRRADPHEAAAYTLDAFRAWTDRSRENIGVDTLDLVQLHCPPTAVFSADTTYDALDTLVAEGRIGSYGVSVETCEEALTAIARPGVASVQIILNAFRQKPLEEVLPAAVEAGVAIIARVPLASGLLSGKYDEHTTFAANDHRTFNRNGESFDVGETFAGVPFDVGVAAAREISALVGDGALDRDGSQVTTSQLALRWILDQTGVTTVIPGARNAAQARSNAAAADLPPLTAEQSARFAEIYDSAVRPHVHARW
ncbi:Predicted oxidoreductase [Sanguibacter gelidistatuariae]|uniref:Predicted oxidoreductase n=1 Tax=Sanguibacter gelidistatuariae TaxID=1814289 RepID=A0A1G6RUJ7_9MICO|nr:aldo/keto reductase [Sanguibacter gelidistatuariae]SDD08312.1 Predicted oxidoreductase [Sanguibacter gelidistatuariae]